MPKVYLSPAAHAADHPCCAVKGCTENTHTNEYLDELIPYLDACGIAWKRNGRDKTGSAAVIRAVKESNAWHADLHYVVHTNGSNGKANGSRPMVYPTGKGNEWANKVAEYRRKVYPYPVTVKTNANLYEILETSAVCVYEELVFHDNAEDASWLHAHIQELAEQTARAFCDIFGLQFVDPYAGDVNGDGKADSTDARLVLQAYAGKAKLTDKQKAAADVNGDGKVNSSDAREILQNYAKK